MNKGLIIFLKWGSFAISLIFSIILMTSQATSEAQFILFLFQAVIIDSFKMTAFLFSNYSFQKGWILSAVAMAILFVCAFTVSIVGSLGYLYNNSLTVVQRDIQNSSGYTRNEEMYQSKLSEIESIKKQIADTTSSYDKQIAELPADYITAKGKLAEQKTAELNRLNELLKSANADLSNINGNFDSIENTGVTKNGYSAFFEQVAKMLNGSKLRTENGKPPLTMQDISFGFSAFLSIFFEIMAMACTFIENNFKKQGSLNTGTKKPFNIGFTKKNQEVTANKTDDLKMVSSPTPSLEATTEYKKYIQKMLANTSVDENGQYKTIGYKKIGSMADLTLTQATQIYNYLKESNHVKVEGLQTCLNSKNLINEYQNNYKNKIGFIK